MEVNIKGLKIRYIVEGEGKDILLLHGWGGSIESFLPVFNSLKNYIGEKGNFNYRIWCLDLPGFGKSQIPSDNWGSYEYANFVKSFLDHFNIKKVILIGHSFGGRLSIILGAKYVDLVEKIILIDSAGIIPKRGLDYYIKVCLYKILKSFFLFFIKDKEKVSDKLSSLFGSKDYKKANKLRKNLVKVVNEDLQPLLKKIKCPVLIFWGENDKDTPLYMGKIMEKEIKDSGLVMLENAGHFSYLDNFYKFDLVLKKFLS